MHHRRDPCVCAYREGTCVCTQTVPLQHAYRIVGGQGALLAGVAGAPYRPAYFVAREAFAAFDPLASGFWG